MQVSYTVLYTSMVEFHFLFTGALAAKENLFVEMLLYLTGFTVYIMQYEFTSIILYSGIYILCLTD